VFQELQAVHFPIHFGNSFPHSVQTKTVLVFINPPDSEYFKHFILKNHEFLLIFILIYYNT